MTLTGAASTAVPLLRSLMPAAAASCWGSGMAGAAAAVAVAAFRQLPGVAAPAAITRRGAAYCASAAASAASAADGKALGSVAAAARVVFRTYGNGAAVRQGCGNGVRLHSGGTVGDVAVPWPHEFGRGFSMSSANVRQAAGAAFFCRTGSGTGIAVAGGVRQLGLPAAAAVTVKGLVRPSCGVMGGAAAAAWPRAAPVRTFWKDNNGYTHFSGRGSLWRPSGRNTMYYYAAAALGGWAAYYVWCLETVPYTGRRHSIMLVSQAGEQWMGEMVFEELTKVKAAEGRLLPPSHPAVQRVQRLGSVIAQVASDGAGGGNDSHMRHLKWQFAVIDDPQPNAAVMPGGKVIVFTGLLKLLGRDDDELAAVLAHEVGHVLARHQAERLSLTNVWALLNMLARLTLGFGLPSLAMYMGIFLPYSRRNEMEADAIGLRLMARACFDPVAAPRMLEKLNRFEKAARPAMHSSLPALLSTHPLTEERVKKVEGELPEAYRLYHGAGCDRVRGAFGRAAEAFGGWMSGGGGGGGGTGPVVEEVEVIRFG